MHRQRDFLLLATLAAAAATPALGQNADPAARAASTAPQSTASAPDLSRLWANTLGPGLPQPASGPGPVRNKARQRQASALDFAAQQGYDLKDYIHGGFVADWWGFTWMIGRAAT